MPTRPSTAAITRTRSTTFAATTFATTSGGHCIAFAPKRPLAVQRFRLLTRTIPFLIPSLSFIESTNRRHLTYKVAANHMTDWHDEEFKALRGSFSTRPAVSLYFDCGLKRETRTGADTCYSIVFRVVASFAIMMANTSLIFSIAQGTYKPETPERAAARPDSMDWRDKGR